MIRLLRTVRFSLNPPEPGRAPEDLGPQTNSFAAYPTMRGLGRHYELDITCLGEVNPQTGYLINIRDVDQAARLAALPVIAHHCL
ncbi:MAG TPA: hypothetical protein VD963_00845, partial [Phycisphaerales bacterium]|nr:hypothetical protein [Phycisphaerales bacterium]